MSNLLSERILEHEDVQNSKFIHLAKAEEVILEGGAHCYVTRQFLAKPTRWEMCGIGHLADMLPTWAEGTERMKGYNWSSDYTDYKRTHLIH